MAPPYDHLEGQNDTAADLDLKGLHNSRQAGAKETCSAGKDGPVWDPEAALEKSAQGPPAEKSTLLVAGYWSTFITLTILVALSEGFQDSGQKLFRLPVATLLFPGTAGGVACLWYAYASGWRKPTRAVVSNIQLARLASISFLVYWSLIAASSALRTVLFLIFMIVPCQPGPVEDKCITFHPNGPIMVAMTLLCTLYYVGLVSMSLQLYRRATGMRRSLDQLNLSVA